MIEDYVAESTDNLDITMTDDAVMYLGDSNVVTASCDVMNLADGQVSSITFDHFQAEADTQFYGGLL